MPTKITFNQAKCPLNNFYHFVETRDWYWGKAYKDDEGDYQVISTPQTCKDYLVDIQYRNSHTIYKNNWTPEQLASNCYYILLPTKVEANFFLKNITEVLNVYEKKNHFMQTKATIMDENMAGYIGPVIVIEGSKCWTRTTTALSFYLSLIRLCGYADNLSADNLLPVLNDKQALKCNEQRYFRSMTAKARELYEYFYQHPRELMPKMSDTISVTGYHPHYKELGHGCTGLFYLLTYLEHVENQHYQSNKQHESQFAYKLLLEMSKNVTV